jgi:hypothetical protein
MLRGLTNAERAEIVGPRPGESLAEWLAHESVTTLRMRMIVGCDRLEFHPPSLEELQAYWAAYPVRPAGIPLVTFRIGED